MEVLCWVCVVCGTPVARLQTEGYLSLMCVSVVSNLLSYSDLTTTDTTNSLQHLPLSHRREAHLRYLDLRESFLSPISVVSIGVSWRFKMRLS